MRPTAAVMAAPRLTWPVIHALVDEVVLSGGNVGADGFAALMR